MILELNHIAIYVAKVEESVAFYQDIIGLEPIPRPAFTFPGAWFKIAGAQQLHIIGQREEEQEAVNTRALSKPRGNHFALRISSADEMEQLLIARNAAFQPPRKRPDGAIQIFLKDPDGYWIEFVEVK